MSSRVAAQYQKGDSSQQAAQNGSSSSSNAVVGLHYKIGKKIGEGSFGVIFEGVNIINNVPVAIKFEPRKTEAPQLRDEYKTYKFLAGSKGVPSAYYFGQEGLHNILVIDLLGPSLEDLFDWCGRRFSVKTTVQVAVQMLSLIETIHAHDLIYRDIKPDNFLIGRPGHPDENRVHLVDFGMAKFYIDQRTKMHIPYREKKSLSGTARYMSVNTHLGREQSRRDDLEALGHVFFYFLRGQLPWQGLKAPTNKQKYEKIGEKKRSTPVLELCAGLPRQFAQYLETVRSLGFDQQPDYDGYKQLLLSVLDDIGDKPDGKYDWQKLNGGRGWDYAINKKPNLHGYGHPNPPGERDRHHRHGQRRSRQQINSTSAVAGAGAAGANPNSTANNNTNKTLANNHQSTKNASNTQLQTSQPLRTPNPKANSQYLVSNNHYNLPTGDSNAAGAADYGNNANVNLGDGKAAANGNAAADARLRASQQKPAKEEESTGFFSKLCCF